jgi:hypothetical protein
MPYIIVLAVVLTVLFVVHKIYVFVMTFMCIGCNPAIVHPDYLVFVGALFLIRIIGRLLFKKSDSKN